MKKETFHQLQENIKNFKYTSLSYCDYEDVSSYEILIDSTSLILLYGYDLEAGLWEYHWACSNVEILIHHLSKTKHTEKISFIPKSWILPFQKAGFEVHAMWMDYICSDIKSDSEDLIYAGDTHITQISKITRSCANQSRGFSGQSETWIKDWLHHGDSVPDYAYDTAILINDFDHPCAMIAIALYGEEKQTCLWIRELAVDPTMQGRGKAGKLIDQAFAYGLKHNAKQAFLLVDACNERALHLYEKKGFHSVSEQGQIDMIRHTR